MVKRLLTLAAVIMAAAVSWAETTFPVTLEITDEASFAQWTVINANEATSANTWTYNSADALYTEDRKNAADDWLVSPAVHLEPGKYEVGGYVVQRSLYSSDKQSFELTMGTAPTAEAQTTVFASESAYTSKLYKATTGVVTVAVAGDYHFAIHLISKSYMGNCGFQKFVISKMAPIPAHVSGLTVEAGAKGALQATLKWTNPTKDSDGADLAKFSGVKVSRGSQLIATLAGAKGEAMTYVDTDITSAGTYTYSVLAYNEDADAKGAAPTATTGWVGVDTPKPVTDLAAVTDGGKVTLTYAAPTEGVNGGYVDLAGLTYRITRGTEVLAEDFAGTTYTDSVASLGRYTYSVQAQAGGKTSTAQSLTVRAGDGFGVPYSESFDQASAADLFTIKNVSGDIRTWKYNSSKKCMEYWGNSSFADHWIFTPPIKLEAGKTYELKFNTGLENAASSTSYKNLEVSVGTVDLVAAQTTKLFAEQIKSAIMEGKTAYYTAPADGSYNFAFRVYGATNSYSIYLDDISVDVAAVIPAAVADFSATPAAKGALAVALSWTNPAKTVSGLDLAAIDKVEVYRGADLISTLENPQPGVAAAVTDSVPAAGVYTYQVYAYVGENRSAAAAVTTAWVGNDTPAAPANATLALADGKPVVTFDAVTAGVNGGYIDTDALAYTITRMPDEAVVAEGVKTTTYTDNSVLPLAKYSYTIVAKVGEQESEAAQTNAIVLGDALELPYHTALDNADDAAIWTMYDANADGKTWSFNASKGYLESGFSSKDGDAAFTPQFRTVKGNHKLTYSVHGYSGRYGDAYNVALAQNSDFADATVIGQYPDKDIAFSMFEERTLDFAVAADGVYSIGFVQKSTDPWGISLCDVTIERVLPTGITEAVAASGVRYDRAAQSLVLAQPGRVTVASVNGAVVAVADAQTALSVAHLAQGVYVATVVGADGKQSHVKFVK